MNPPDSTVPSISFKAPTTSDSASKSSICSPRETRSMYSKTSKRSPNSSCLFTRVKKKNRGPTCTLTLMGHTTARTT
ncbi:hypothetical protein BDM02DRAFT_873030 [Thelephora ganbajun]|uniref:Uncharacterized protein n=1 Tax=Thelephora ganbajun TaxID=370292 RepID=A0ACB6Z639_THEGA|nr:hypothetical protein BDM02DRAFT_873030 [Thelephora ganbajun]